ncbi:Abscisic acid G-protein coupled receptor-domain-containing protein [Infundibulicybe gibba]|nr:Abscisic acid G-protein coupled receptor-domain-containing protein [Infundibulicybe gibba]
MSTPSIDISRLSPSKPSEAILLVVLRISLFFACRKFLLRSLYSNLQHLSSLRGPIPHHHDSIELNRLPMTQLPRSNDPAPHSRIASLHSTTSRVLFSTCFSESCIMFILLMCEGVDVFSPRTRIMNWKFSLLYLMAAILLIIPICISVLLATQTRANESQSSRKRFPIIRILFSFIPVVVYLIGLSYVPLPNALPSPNFQMAILSRLVFLGTIIIGLLSGFGAINNAWDFIPRGPRIVPGDSDIEANEYSLASIRKDIETRRVEAEMRAGKPRNESWITHVMLSFRGGDDRASELRGLQLLEQDMSLKLEALYRPARQIGVQRRSEVGSPISAVDSLLAIALAEFLVLFVLVDNSSTPKAPHVDVNDIAFVSRQLSLLLVGLMILSSIRIVLLAAARALHVTSRNLGASIMLLLLAQIMGIYLLSTIAQLRSTFPPPAASLADGAEPAADLFSTIPEYKLFGSLFDASFLFAAAGTMVSKWAAEKIGGVKVQ